MALIIENTFVNGFPAVANEVNENFAAVKTFVDALQDGTGIDINAITESKIATNAVTQTKIADRAVGSLELANLTTSTKVASYSLVAADRNTRVIMNSGTSTTISVTATEFSAGDVVYIHNIGVGTTTVTAAGATVTTAGSLAVAQWGGGTLYFTSASAAIFFSNSGLSYGEATGTPSVSSTYSDGGFNWKRIDFTASNNLVVSKSGIFDLMIIGGGGGGGSGVGYGGEGGGGAGAGIMQNLTVYVPVGTYAVTIGAGGATGTPATFGGWTGVSIIKSQVAGGAGGGQSWGGAVAGPNSGGASYRGGYGGNSGVASQQLYGFSSGGSNGSTDNGGGAGMGGAGGTRTAGAGVASTFTGASITYAAGGLGGGTSGTNGPAGGANTGTGGGGAIAANPGTNGGSGVVIVRWKVA